MFVYGNLYILTYAMGVSSTPPPGSGFYVDQNGNYYINENGDRYINDALEEGE